MPAESASAQCSLQVCRGRVDSPKRLVRFPTGTAFQEVEREDVAFPRDSWTSVRGKALGALPALLALFSWCFSGEQGGSHEDILNCRVLRSPRPRGRVLEAAT